jgi:hypothetical protein
MNEKRWPSLRLRWPPFLPRQRAKRVRESRIPPDTCPGDDKRCVMSVKDRVFPSKLFTCRALFNGQRDAKSRVSSPPPAPAIPIIMTPRYTSADLPPARPYLFKNSVYSACRIIPDRIMIVWKHWRSMAHNLQSDFATKKQTNKI